MQYPHDVIANGTSVCIIGNPGVGKTPRRVYRLYDFTRAHVIAPGEYYCVAGKVNSADKLYLVIESVKRDTKTQPRFRSSGSRGRRRRINHEVAVCAAGKNSDTSAVT